MILFSKMVKDEKIKLLSFTILMSAVSIAQVVLWPTLRKILPAFEEAVPQALKWIIGGMISEGFIFYTLTQQIVKNIGMFGSFFAVMLAASAIARERESGTLELLLAQPVSRLRVITEKYLFNSIVLAIPVIISTLLTHPAGLLVKEDTNIFYLLLAGIYSYFVLHVIYSIIFLLGMFIDDQMQVIYYGLGLTIILTILALFQETEWFSIYGWLKIDRLLGIMTEGLFPLDTIALMILLSGIFFVASVLKFRKLNI